jgi:hypothetical protein
MLILQWLGFGPDGTVALFFMFEYKTAGQEKTENDNKE